MANVADRLAGIGDTSRLNQYHQHEGHPKDHRQHGEQRVYDFDFVNEELDHDDEDSRDEVHQQDGHADGEGGVEVVDVGFGFFGVFGELLKGENSFVEPRKKTLTYPKMNPLLPHRSDIRVQKDDIQFTVERIGGKDGDAREVDQ